MRCDGMDGLARSKAEMPIRIHTEIKPIISSLIISKMIWLLTALTLCSIGQLPCARGGAAEPEAGVVEELTPESMSAAIQGSEHPILVDFYAVRFISLACICRTFYRVVCGV